MQVLSTSQIDKGKIKAEILIPHASAAADIDIDVSGHVLTVTCGSSIKSITLPAMVDDDNIQARFDTKSRILKLKLAVKDLS